MEECIRLDVCQPRQTQFVKLNYKAAVRREHVITSCFTSNWSNLQIYRVNQIGTVSQNDRLTDSTSMAEREVHCLI